jgi:peptidyl-prolyl cis-trans isomerase D
MAVIGKIRKYSGLLIVLIGVALAAFVLQDLVGPKRCNRNRSVEFARIGDEKINKVDFDARVARQEELYKQQTGKANLTPAENFQVMTSAWDEMEKEVIMLKQYENLGLALAHDGVAKPGISPEELYDLVAGKFLHPYIIQSFTDPATGVLNRQGPLNFLNNFDQLSEEQKTQWKNLEDAIKEDRIKTKYNNLIAKAYYMPKAFAKRMYDESNRSAQLTMVGLKYQTISDSSITLTDEDYKKYYDAHSYEYEVDPSVDIDYVIWDVVPSDADKKKVEAEVATTFKNLQTLDLKDIEPFVTGNSDELYDSTFKKKGTLPVQMDSILFNSPVGTLIPPYLEGNTYHMAALVQTQMRPDSMKVSQLAIFYKGAPGLNPEANVPRTREQAKLRADSILTILKKDPKMFATLALQRSDFPEVTKDSGDLKWIVDGDINTKIFFDSCLTMKTGEFRIIESSLGYHVIALNGRTKDMKKVKFANIIREIKPGTQTFNTYYTLASEFAGQSRTLDEFNKTIAAKGLNKRSAQFVRKMDYSLPGLEASREIIRWAFDKETEVKTVSPQVFDAQGKYVVAVVLDRREKGIATLEQVKTYIEPLVKRDKKAEKLIADMKAALNTTKDLPTLAAKFSTKVDTVNSITFSAYNMPNYGPEPTVIGTIFTLKPNVLSAPVKGDMAVYVLNLNKINEAPPTDNYTMMQAQMAAFFRQRIENDVFNALKKETDIIDNRILYY